jgi:coenzyme F420-0:L-glutamate ligase/coenzyme F420-1:gamma-L-glutamate ligase
MITARALRGVPEIHPGDDLGAILAGRAREAGVSDDDVLVIAHKVVSKAEGCIVILDDIEPGAEAQDLGHRHDKDPRHVQVVLDETAELMRAERGVLICRTHHGFVCANAGVDTSNLAAEGTVLTLPRDPDASARRLRAAIRRDAGAAPAIVIADSFGRAWRHGQADVAIGAAGLRALDDWRGRTDRRGMEMRATWIAIADEAAAAADLARAGKDSGEPAVLVSGLGAHVTADDGPGAGPLLRARDEDLFR